jgi:hypothetical protein
MRGLGARGGEETREQPGAFVRAAHTHTHAARGKE